MPGSVFYWIHFCSKILLPPARKSNKSSAKVRQCAVFGVQCVVSSVPCKVCSVHVAMCSKCATCSLTNAVCHVKCAVCRLQCAASVQSAVCTVQSPVWSLIQAVYSVYCVVFTESALGPLLSRSCDVHLCVCFFVPFPYYFCWGPQVDLRSQDQFEASHWSTPLSYRTPTYWIGPTGPIHS